MAAIVETRLSALQDLCRRFGVRRLEVFGSATRDDFDSARSDIDILVAFGSSAAMTPFEQYFGFKEAVERLFGRDVDVVVDGASHNPYFLESVNASRQLVYEA
jgi:predicted nucleotidyltransferase